MRDALNLDCGEWQAVAEVFPDEMEVIVDMLIEAEVEICN